MKSNDYRDLNNNNHNVSILGINAMNARVVGKRAYPTDHFRERLAECFNLSDYGAAERDIVNRIRNLDCTLIGRGENCERLKVLLYSIYPAEVRRGKTGELITIFPRTYRRSKR